MTAIIHDSDLEARIRANRTETGADRFDEVWEGVYVVSPLANDEHQKIVSRLVSIFEEVIGWPELGEVRPGVNISDRIEGWRDNYRCPDVAVFMKGTTAENRDAFWYGGPDLAVEVVSPGEQPVEKLSFYARVRTKEVLVINRNPWSLELYQLVEGKLVPVVPSSIHLVSQLGFSFRIQESTPRPCIIVRHHDKEWRI